ncbi:MAG: hypothetical protein ACRC17_00875 [Culicoidibacterales bacterium]
MLEVIDLIEYKKALQKIIVNVTAKNMIYQQRGIVKKITIKEYGEIKYAEKELNNTALDLSKIVKGQFGTKIKEVIEEDSKAIASIVNIKI